MVYSINQKLKYIAENPFELQRKNPILRDSKRYADKSQLESMFRYQKLKSPFLVSFLLPAFLLVVLLLPALLLVVSLMLLPALVSSREGFREGFRQRVRVN